MIEHPRDDLAAYALGALDQGDRARVATHVVGCDECRRETEAYDDVVWSVAESAAATPPTHLRARIVRRESSRGIGSSSLWATPWRALLRPVPLAVPLTLAALLVVAVVGALQARTDADAYARAVAGVVDARVVALAPAVDSAARGALVVPSSGASYLILQLPAPPTGKTWEAWVIRGERPLAAGITGERAGLVTLVLTQPLVPGDAVAVTIEDAGGVAAPRGRVELLGKT